jgi:ABC-type nitrate/sulfonate/bicarbonate transport system substrate-binding protein
MSRIKDFERRLFCLCAAAMIGACTMTSSAHSQIRSIVIGEGVRGAMYLPAYIAEEKGFFKRRELATKIVTFSRSNDINVLVSGDIQFDLTAPDKVITPPSAGFR